MWLCHHYAILGYHSLSHYVYKPFACPAWLWVKHGIFVQIHHYLFTTRRVHRGTSFLYPRCSLCGQPLLVRQPNATTQSNLALFTYSKAWRVSKSPLQHSGVTRIADAIIIFENGNTLDSAMPTQWACDLFQLAPFWNESFSSFLCCLKTFPSHHAPLFKTANCATLSLAPAIALRLVWAADATAGLTTSAPFVARVCSNPVRINHILSVEKKWVTTAGIGPQKSRIRWSCLEP